MNKGIDQNQFEIFIKTKAIIIIFWCFFFHNIICARFNNALLLKQSRMCRKRTKIKIVIIVVCTCARARTSQCCANDFGFVCSTKVFSNHHR